jgi:hypothetical protein
MNHSLLAIFLKNRYAGCSSDRSYGPGGRVIRPVRPRGGRALFDLFFENRQCEIQTQSGSRDTLIIRVELTSELRRGIATMRGIVFICDKVVSEADFTAQIIKNK